MVLETSHTGVTNQGLNPAQQAAAGGGQAEGGAELPVAGSRDIYTSTRVAENWELMRIAHTISQDFGSWRVVNELINKNLADNISRGWEDKPKGKTEGTYLCLLSWKNNKAGYAQIGEVCRALKKNGWTQLAESFKP